MGVQACILAIRGAAATAGFRSTLDRLGFVEVHTPKIVASSTDAQWPKRP